MTQRVAIIEDEQEVSDRFSGWLKEQIHDLVIDQWLTREDGERAIAEYSYDLIVMDVMFGHDRFAGIGMIDAINRKSGPPTPVLVVTGLESESYRALIKELGVFEFLQKPISSHDFVGTALDILRQKKATDSAPAQSNIRSDRLHLAPLEGSPRWNGKAFKLALSGQRILAAIYRARPHTVTYDDLFRIVTTGATKDNIRKHIGQIREAIQEVDPDFDLIKADPNKGFRWAD